MARTPNFFIVGAPKCGTTAMARYLAEHPKIFITDPKEPNFFTREFEVYQRQYRSDDEYLALYNDAQEDHQAVGEASVWTLYSQSAVPEILDRFPHAKFIAMVRNPVIMAESLHAQMLLMREEEVENFESAWALQDKRSAGKHIPEICREPTFLLYREVCSLGDQVARLLRVAGKENCHVVVFDDFVKNTAQAYASALEFLEVEHDGRSEFPVINANREYRWASIQSLLIKAPVLLRPLVRNLKRILPVRRFGLLDKAVKMNMRQTQRHRPDPSFRQQLAREFADDIHLLGETIERDLDQWTRC